MAEVEVTVASPTKVEVVSATATELAVSRTASNIELENRPVSLDLALPGPQGPPGARGIDGARGVDGAIGPPGPQGVKGDTATNPVVPTTNNQPSIDLGEGSLWFNPTSNPTDTLASSISGSISAQGNGGTVTITIPAITKAGDIIIMAIGCNGTPTPPSGFRQIEVVVQGNHSGYMFSKRATAGDAGSNITITESGGEQFSIHLIVVTNAKRVSLIKTTNAASGALALPVWLDTLAITISFWSARGGAGTTYTVSPGYTQRTNIQGNNNQGVVYSASYASIDNGHSRNIITSSAGNVNTVFFAICVTNGV